MVNIFTLVLIILSQIIFGNFFNAGKIVESYAMEESERVVRLPILMFHSFTTDENEALPNTVVTAEKFTKVIDILRENGYKSISFTELMEYLDGKGELPEKPYVITADDGYLNNYELMYPVLKEKNEKAVISVIGESLGIKKEWCVGGKTYSPKIGWEEINEMVKSGLVEIGNHTYKMHDRQNIYDGDRNGGVINEGEIEATYAKKFSEDVLKLNSILKEHCDIEPQIFCYPYGYFDVLSEALLSGCGFNVSLTVDEGMNLIKNKDDLKMMKRYNVDMETDIEELITKWESIKFN